MIAPAVSLHRRDAGLPDRLGWCLAGLALLVAAAALLLSGPAPARAIGGSTYGCTAASSVAVLGARTQVAEAPAAKAERVVFDEAGLRAADVEAPAELGLPTACATPARSRPATAAAYPEPRRAGLLPPEHGSPLRPPRAA